MGQEVAQALLGAALYLLAWAKGHWLELGGHGVADRLAFLWQWGSGRGLAWLGEPATLIRPSVPGMA
jgi:hypothetical protein